MITFESPRKRGNWFLFMLGLLGILTIASIILTLSEISLLQQIQAGEEVTDSDIDTLDNYWIAYGFFWLEHTLVVLSCF